ncbi:hypothetical protein [Undibacterium sp. TJN19]|uniref:hypothetical protein n=1 Tax=Undibacterium sp. TJN19 TaxID=3413055 RepID=UPI003BF4111E
MNLSWFDFLKIQVVFFFTSAVLSLIIKSPETRLLNKFTLPAMLIMLVFKDLSEATAALQRLKKARQQGGGWVACIPTLLPSEITAFFRLDRAMWRGFYAWLSQKKTTRHPEGEAFGFLNKGSYSTVFAIILLALCTEIPFSALMIALIEADPAKRHLVHIILFALTAYSLIWLLGDRYLVNHSHHILSETDLYLKVGARSTGKIPRSAIVSCEYFTHDDAQRPREKLRYPANSIVVTPFDRPNLVISLHADAILEISHFQLNRTGLTKIFLFVDQPARLKLALDRDPA